MDLSQKRIVLTGAASGIGLALLDELAKLDVQLLAADINQQGLQEAVNRLGQTKASIKIYTGDLSLSTTVDRLFTTAIQEMGGIDLFIANAGFPYYEVIQQPDWDHIQKIFQLIVFPQIYTFEKMMDINQGKEFKMVMTASAMGVMAMPGYALYSATKAALHRFAEGVRLELRNPHQLMLVYPIATRTGFFKRASQSTPIPWPAQTSEVVARAILNGIRHDRLSVNPSLLFSLIIFLDRFQPFIRWGYQKYYSRLLNKK